MEKQIFAADSFYGNDGSIATDSNEPLCLAFIGGSLTSSYGKGDLNYEGPADEYTMARWPNPVMRYFHGLFPKRPLEVHNAALGGTGTSYAAIRFVNDVLKYKPDVIFIEFTVNDLVREEVYDSKLVVSSQMWLESMILQASRMEKVPAIVYIHLPRPVPEGEPLDRTYRNGLAWKNQLLYHYGIEPIDVDNKIRNLFNLAKAEDSSVTFDSFFSKYYPYAKSGNGFDVHANNDGYFLMSRYILDALASDFRKYIRPFAMDKFILCESQKDIVLAKYNYISASNECIKFSDGWTLYDRDNRFETDDPKTLINPGQYGPNCFGDGIRQTINSKDEYFEFDTEADALCFPYPSAVAGLGADVFSDGEPVGHVSCQSIYHSMNYSGKWVELPSGKKHIRVAIDNAGEDFYVFRFGFIVERFNK